MALQWQEENLNQSSNSQQTPHTLPLRASYGVDVYYGDIWRHSVNHVFLIFFIYSSFLIIFSGQAA